MCPAICRDTGRRLSRAYDAYKDGTLSWWNALDVGVNVPGFGLAARGFKGTFGDALAGRTGPGILSRIKSMNNGGILIRMHLFIGLLLNMIQCQAGEVKIQYQMQ